MPAASAGGKYRVIDPQPGHKQWPIKAGRHPRNMSPSVLAEVLAQIAPRPKLWVVQDLTPIVVYKTKTDRGQPHGEGEKTGRGASSPGAPRGFDQYFSESASGR